MFDQSRSQLHEVVVKVQQKETGKQNVFIMNVVFTDTGDIYIWDILRRVQEIFQFSHPLLFYYYDYAQDTEVCLQTDNHTFVHHSSILKENMISLRAESQISDEALANPELKPPTSRTKRSPQRYIFESFEMVESWRRLYREGTKKGVKEKVNLDKAASLLEIPRKTLEDYYLLIRNGANYGFNFTQNSRQKIGVLRLFVKEKRKGNQPITQNIKATEQIKFLNQIRKQIFGLTQQEKEQDLFNVVEVDEENGGSDEDMAEQLIFEN